MRYEEKMIAKPDLFYLHSLSAVCVNDADRDIWYLNFLLKYV